MRLIFLDRKLKEKGASFKWVSMFAISEAGILRPFLASVSSVFFKLPWKRYYCVIHRMLQTRAQIDASENLLE